MIAQVIQIECYHFLCRISVIHGFVVRKTVSRGTFLSLNLWLQHMKNQIRSWQMNSFWNNRLQFPSLNCIVLQVSTSINLYERRR